ncbi:MAG: hypothetical protein H6658_04745 [Ardenticatenaceae bacterium]|nr:hypothetical protein [Ardenticatenaceae bacterium]
MWAARNQYNVFPASGPRRRGRGFGAGLVLGGEKDEAVKLMRQRGLRIEVGAWPALAAAAQVV